MSASAKDFFQAKVGKKPVAPKWKVKWPPTIGDQKVRGWVNWLRMILSWKLRVLRYLDDFLMIV